MNTNRVYGPSCSKFFGNDLAEKIQLEYDGTNATWVGYITILQDRMTQILNSKVPLVQLFELLSSTIEQFKTCGRVRRRHHGDAHVGSPLSDLIECTQQVVQNQFEPQASRSFYGP